MAADCQPNDVFKDKAVVVTDIDTFQSKEIDDTRRTKRETTKVLRPNANRAQHDRKARKENLNRIFYMNAS